MNITFKISMRFIHLLVFSFGVLILTDLRVLAQEEKQDVPKIIEVDEELEARAKRAADAFQSKGMVNLIDQMGPRVRGLFGEFDDGARGETVTTNGVLPDSPFRAILFASSSMPLKLLRAYAEQLEKANGVIVFRGMPGGMSRMKPIITLTNKMILRDLACKGENCAVFNVGVIVDPIMFEANSVDRVPALTIVDHDPFAAYCERPDEAALGATGRFVTFGDVHLTGHLETLITLGDPRARRLLLTLRAEETAP